MDFAFRMRCFHSGDTTSTRMGRSGPVFAKLFGCLFTLDFLKSLLHPNLCDVSKLQRTQENLILLLTCPM